MKQEINEKISLQKLAGLLKENENLNEKGKDVFSSKNKATMTGTPIDGGVDSDGNKYDPFEVEVDIDTFRLIQGKNVIEISRKASKVLAKEIRDSFF